MVLSETMYRYKALLFLNLRRFFLNEKLYIIVPVDIINVIPIPNTDKSKLMSTNSILTDCISVKININTKVIESTDKIVITILRLSK